VRTIAISFGGAIKNGELLALAEEQLEVFATVDQNLSFQQNLAALSIATRTSSSPGRQHDMSKRRYFEGGPLLA
jgi:hypothetical protein